MVTGEQLGSIMSTVIFPIVIGLYIGKYFWGKLFKRLKNKRSAAMKANEDEQHGWVDV